MRNAMIAAVAAALLGASSTAGAVTINNRIVNGDFQEAGLPMLSGWSPGGDTTSVQARPANDAIDGVGTVGVDDANRFDNFFTTGGFAVLGDDPAISAVIGGAPASGLFALSQQFILQARRAGQDVLSYDLTVNFDYAFDGVVAANPPIGAADDLFTATLYRVNPDNQHILATYDLFSASLGVNRTHQLDGHFTSSHLLDLVPGSTYVLAFVLQEQGAGFNSAVGIDNVNVSGTAAVPVPGAVYLFGSALAALAWSLRRRSMAA